MLGMYLLSVGGLGQVDLSQMETALSRLRGFNIWCDDTGRRLQVIGMVVNIILLAINHIGRQPDNLAMIT